ncbi:MAG: SurA N-terminal domain-containing protein [Candidatus Saccharimonas sp.]
MKKILHKMRRSKQETPPSRITNETVAEHREQILAGGRKFKYPVQYARHKLVFNALIITAVALVLMAAIGWWQLYPMQNSSEFMYRLTRILPVPVASVNGNSVLYQDYLVQYRSSEYYIAKYGDIRLDSNDGKRQLDYIRRQALDMAERVAYAKALAGRYNIKVTEAEIDAFIDQERNTANGRVSQETYDASIQMLYGESASDYRLKVANGMIKNRVAFAVDDSAAAQVKSAEPLVKETSGDFMKVAEQMKGSKGGQLSVGQSGMVSLTSKFNGLRVSELSKLEKDQVSGVLKSTTDDGYYFVKIVDKSETQVNFVFLHIPLTKFDQDFAKLKTDKKVQEYISVPEAASN